MIIARWQIDARFGHKQKVMDSMTQWSKDIGSQIGLANSRMLSGSIGVLEATIEHEVEVADLAELERAWAKLATIDAHKQWSKELEPYVVSGTARWSIYRVV